MLNSVQLGQTDERCKEISPDEFSKKIDFGGLSVILILDFQQVPPVGGECLYKGALQCNNSLERGCSDTVVQGVLRFLKS